MSRSAIQHKSMGKITAQVVICGAGIAGVSAAYFLAVQSGVKDIILVDERPPLSLTSDHSTECYRNWWPGPGEAMVAMMNRSIDWLERLAGQSGNIFHLNRRGYLYCSADPQQVEQMRIQAEEISRLGAGVLRVHNQRSRGSAYTAEAMCTSIPSIDGADFLLSQDLIHQYFPYLTADVKAALHVRRAGWFSAQQLGMYMLDQARQAGVKLLVKRASGVDLCAGRVQRVFLADGDSIETQCLVNAAGPFLGEVCSWMGIKLPVFNELHLKVAFQETVNILPRQAPLVIWNDPQRLDWTAEERAFLSEDPSLQYLLQELPGGVHSRPEGEGGSQVVLLLWEYLNRRMKPIFPIPDDPHYLEVALKGLTRMLPGMQVYLRKLPQPRYDGGYYTKAFDNRPIIGKLTVDGAYIIGALSGFGMMAACAAGELLALSVTNGNVPSYAQAFGLERFNDPEYVRQMDQASVSGQL